MAAAAVFAGGSPDMILVCANVSRVSVGFPPWEILSQLSDLGRSIQQGEFAGCLEHFLDLGSHDCVTDRIDLGCKEICAGGTVQGAAVVLLDRTRSKTFGKVRS